MINVSGVTYCGCKTVSSQLFPLGVMKVKMYVLYTYFLTVILIDRESRFFNRSVFRNR
jgi:hypothetical protein